MAKIRFILDEGLVKIPDNIIKEGTNIILGVIKEYVDLPSDILYNLPNIKELIDFGDDTIGKTIRDKFTISGLPEKELQITIALDLVNSHIEDSDTNALYLEDIILVSFNSDKITEALDNLILDRNCDKFKFEISSILEHELTHWIESKFIGKLDNKISKKKYYDTDLTSYLTSTIEYESNLRNVLNDAKRMMNKKKPTDYKEFVKTFIDRNNFLNVLKDNNPTRYKNAVNKIYKELNEIQ